MQGIPVRAYNEDIGIYGKVFTISASDIDTDRSICAFLEELLYYRPRLTGKMTFLSVSSCATTQGSSSPYIGWRRSVRLSAHTRYARAPLHTDRHARQYPSNPGAEDAGWRDARTHIRCSFADSAE